MSRTVADAASGPHAKRIGPHHGSGSLHSSWSDVADDESPDALRHVPSQLTRPAIQDRVVAPRPSRARDGHRQDERTEQADPELRLAGRAARCVALHE